VRSEIKGFEGVTSWFELCLKGEQEMENRFILVPKDKYPIVTTLLKRTVSSWDNHPTVVGNIPETQLRKASIKFVELHQRIKPRIRVYDRIFQVSVPTFLREYLVPYLLNNINRDAFQIYWLQSDKFLWGFEQYLEEAQVISRAPTVRNLRRGGDNDQGVSRRGGNRTTYRNRADYQHELSAADF
jgi:hypothetical protein